MKMRFDLTPYVLLFCLLVPSAKAAPEPEAAALFATRPSKATATMPFRNSIGMTFVPLPGTRVLFSQFETTLDQYELFRQERQLPEPHSFLRHSIPNGGTEPVVGVSAYDAEAFCDWLSIKEKRRYRLPTDTEWSRAAGIFEEETTTGTPQSKRGRLPEAYPWGKEKGPLPPQGFGNFASTELRSLPQKIIEILEKINPENLKAAVQNNYSDGFAYAAPTGSFKPNALGIYDLSGNVWEWLNDAFAEDDSQRVIRGASWLSFKGGELNLSARLALPADMRSNVDVGFRVVLDRTDEFDESETQN